MKLTLTWTKHKGYQEANCGKICYQIRHPQTIYQLYVIINGEMDHVTGNKNMATLKRLANADLKRQVIKLIG